MAPLLVATACLLAPPAGTTDPEQIKPPAVADTGPRPDLAAVAGRIVTATADFRKTEGRPAVTVSPRLTAAARAFAGYMATTDRYGHTADGRQPADRATAKGYDYCLVLENIAYAFDSRGFADGALADGFVVGWKESPGHRRNMLDPDATETGVGVARSSATGHYYAVQLFGRPKAAAVTVRVANRAGVAVEYAVGGEPFTLPPQVVRTHTLCRPAEVVLRWPGDGVPPTTLRPAGAARLVVTRDGDQFRVSDE